MDYHVVKYQTVEKAYVYAANMHLRTQLPFGYLRELSPELLLCPRCPDGYHNKGVQTYDSPYNPADDML